MSSIQSLRAGLADRLAVDVRGLAAFRIGLGSVLLLSLWLRLGELRAFYTDAGVLPRSLLFDVYPGLGRLSLHAAFGGLWWQLVLFGATAVAALSLVAGYHSRLGALVAFFLVASLHARNPVVLTAGDSLLRRLLLWAALLPVGARWAADARDFGTGDGTPTRVLSVASAGVLVQVLVVYLVNAVIKLRGEAWPAGRAVRYVFGLDALTVRLGDVLAGRALLLTIGNYAWLCLLVASPLLVLATRRRRALLVGLFAGGHLLMLATLRLGTFPLVSLVALLPLLPSVVWDGVDERLAGVRNRLAGAGPRPSTAPVPPRLIRLTRRSRRAVAAGLLAFVVVWNAASVGLLVLPSDVTETVDPERRRWDMFAPEPRRTGGWYVTVGTTTDGRRVDVFVDAGRSGRPFAPEPTYPSHGWYVYLTHLRRPVGEPLRPGFARYLCSRWNRNHAAELATVTVIFVAERVRLSAPDPTDRRSFGTYSCPA